MKKVIVKEPREVIIDDEGHVRLEWNPVKELTGHLLPVNNEYVRKIYGINEEVQYRFLFKGRSDALVVGNAIADGDRMLLIVYVADYERAMDVILKSNF